MGVIKKVNVNKTRDGNVRCSKPIPWKAIKFLFMKTLPLLRSLLAVALLLPYLSWAEDGHDGDVNSTIPLNEINVRAYRYFHKTWPAAEGETWYRTDKEYIALFKTRTHLKKVFFSRQGSFLYCIEYYPGVDLPVDVARSVREKYPDFEINAVTMVSREEKVVYFVHIKNALSFKTLSIIDGVLKVQEEMINGEGAGTTALH